MGFKIVAIPDLHAPFTNKPAIKQLLKYIKRIKPNYIIQLGDAYDFWSLSRFTKSFNVKGMYRPIDEVNEARVMMEDFWRVVNNAHPKATRIQLLGNHDERLPRTIAENMPELVGILQFKHFFEFKGVHTHHDTREPLIIEDIAFEHGYLTGSTGKHMKHNLMSTVHGHTHHASIMYLTTKDKKLFNMECGHLADPTSAALGYTRSKWVNWQCGFGLIDEDGPRFIPL